MGALPRCQTFISLDCCSAVAGAFPSRKLSSALRCLQAIVAAVCLPACLPALGSARLAFLPLALELHIARARAQPAAAAAPAQELQAPS